MLSALRRGNVRLAVARMLVWALAMGVCATLLSYWQPWAVVRIVSFVTLGVVLAGPMLSRIVDFRFDWRAARPLAGYAALGLVVDVVMKALLAPAWQKLLLRVAGW